MKKIFIAITTAFILHIPFASAEDGFDKPIQFNARAFQEISDKHISYQEKHQKERGHYQKTLKGKIAKLFATPDKENTEGAIRELLGIYSFSEQYQKMINDAIGRLNKTKEDLFNQLKLEQAKEKKSFKRSSNEIRRNAQHKEKVKSQKEKMMGIGNILLQNTHAINNSRIYKKIKRLTEQRKNINLISESFPGGTNKSGKNLISEKIGMVNDDIEALLLNKDVLREVSAHLARFTMRLRGNIEATISNGGTPFSTEDVNKIIKSTLHLLEDEVEKPRAIDLEFFAP